MVAGEDEGDRAEHQPLADAVRGRVEEGAERRLLPPDPGQRPVEDVEDRPDDEHQRPEPEEDVLVPALEEDEHGGRRAERHAGGREGVGSHPRPGEAEHGTRRQAAGAARVARLDAVDRLRPVHLRHRRVAMPRL